VGWAMPPTETEKNNPALRVYTGELVPGSVVPSEPLCLVQWCQGWGCHQDSLYLFLMARREVWWNQQAALLLGDALRVVASGRCFC